MSEQAQKAFNDLCGGSSLMKFDSKRFKRDIDAFKSKREKKKNIQSGGESDDEDEEEEDDDDDESASEEESESGSDLDSESSSSSESDDDEEEEEEEKIDLYHKRSSGQTTTSQKDGKKNAQKSTSNQTEEELGNVMRKQYKIKIKGDDRNLIPNPLRSFEDLVSSYGMSEQMLRRVKECGWTEPTAIQRQAIPLLLSGGEVLAVAPTGSGKTLAFLLPIFMKLGKRKDGGVRAILLAPTKELAQQSTRICTLLSSGLRVTQLSKATASNDFDKVDIIVSTPLRLAQLLEEKKISTHAVEFLVLDEADKLFEMGFVEQIDAVVHACDSNQTTTKSSSKKNKKGNSKEEQTTTTNTRKRCLKALFSATLPETAERLARSVMHHCVRLTVGERNSANESISQKLVFCGKESGKILAIRQMVQKGVRTPLIIFAQSKDRCVQVAKELAGGALGQVGLIHSDMSDKKRKSIVDEFRVGKLNCLVATDLMARGMDFAAVGTVVNFDFPLTSTSYIHRIGRSGRAGRLGEAVTFFTEEDAKRGTVRAIARVMKRSGCAVPNWLLTLEADKSEKKYKPMRKDGRENNPRRDRVDNKEGYVSRDIRQGKKKLEHKKQRKAMFKEMKRIVGATTTNGETSKKDEVDDYFEEEEATPKIKRSRDTPGKKSTTTTDSKKRRKSTNDVDYEYNNLPETKTETLVFSSKKKKRSRKSI